MQKLIIPDRNVLFMVRLASPEVAVTLMLYRCFLLRGRGPIVAVPFEPYCEIET